MGRADGRPLIQPHAAATASACHPPICSSCRRFRLARQASGTEAALRRQGWGAYLVAMRGAGVEGTWGTQGARRLGYG